MKNIIFTTLIIVTIVFIFPTLSFAQVTFRFPVNTGTPINSYFDNNLSLSGTQKYDCSTSSTRSGHRGVDIPVSTGTPVIAGGAGRIYDTWNNCPDISGANGSDPKCGGPTNPGNSYGNYYRLDHAGNTSDGSGLVSIYAHMKASSITIPIGTPVSCSQQLGQSASSGDAAGPHLHFELRTNGLTKSEIDPFIGTCSHTTPPNWTSVNNSQPTTTCDNHPLAPSNAAVSSPTANSLVIKFKDNSLNETNTLVERKIGTGGGWVSYGSFGALSGASNNLWSWTNTGLWPGTTYCYRLRSQNGTLYSLTYSNEACGSTTNTSPIPLTPSNVTITNPTSSSLQVNFKDNATNETNILVERKINTTSGTWLQVASFAALTGTSSWYWTNTGLASQTNFCYRLRAVTTTGSSAYSSQACGTTL